MKREDIDALLFDLGGVVIGIDFGLTLDHWARSAGVAPEAVRQRFGQGEPYRRFERGEIDAAAYYAAMREELGLALDDARLAEGWNQLFLPAIEPTVELLRALRGRVPLHLFSNTNLAHHEHWARRYAEALAPFDRIFTSCGIGKRKPERAAFEHVAREIGVPPGRILFFDDTEANVVGAREAGMHAVHVRSPDDVARAVRPWL